MGVCAKGQYVLVTTTSTTRHVLVSHRKRYGSARTSRPELAISEQSLCITEACLHGWMDACSPAPWLVCGCASSVTVLSAWSDEMSSSTYSLVEGGG